MAVLSLTLATLMCVAGVRQFLHPWDLRHHAFFHGEPPSCALHALAMLGPTIAVTKDSLQKLPEQQLYKPAVTGTASGVAVL
jgi:hypothetical protein